MSTRLVNRRWI